jgi:hypothetical protein
MRLCCGVSGQSERTLDLGFAPGSIGNVSFTAEKACQIQIEHESPLSFVEQ